MQSKSRNIFLLLLAVFLFFVAYKYIATGIQENKEKAVIQERANVEQEETRQRAYNLEQCFNLAQIDEKSKTDWYTDDFNAKYGNNNNLWAQPVKVAYVQLFEEAQEETKAKRAECMKQYPQ